MQDYGRPSSSSHYQGPPTPTTLTERDIRQEAGMPPIVGQPDKRKALTLPPLSHITSIDHPMTGDGPIAPRSMPAGPPLDPRLSSMPSGGLPLPSTLSLSKKRPFDAFSLSDGDWNRSYKNGSRPAEERHQERVPMYERANGEKKAVGDDMRYLWS